MLVCKCRVLTNNRAYVGGMHSQVLLRATPDGCNMCPSHSSSPICHALYLLELLTLVSQAFILLKPAQPGPSMCLPTNGHLRARHIGVAYHTC